MLKGCKISTERGRTLTETLTMLAIVGILSVAGLKGYNSAMDKNKANTIINEAQKRATLVVPQIQMMNNLTPTLNEFINNNLGYAEFDTTVYTNSNLPDISTGQFGIKVSGVAKNICQNILNTIGDNSVIRRLSTTDAPKVAITECGETNAFLMVYNNDMTTNDKVEEVGPTTCKNNNECKTECATCKIESGEEEGICVGECESACEVGDTCGDNECVVCDEESKTCQNQCEEVEYLLSEGSSYINTGLLSTANSKVDVVFGFSSMSSGTTQNSAVFGGRSASQYTHNTFTFFKLASQTPQRFRFDYNNQQYVGSASNMTWDTMSKYRMSYDGSAIRVANITTNQSEQATMTPDTVFTTQPIYLFAVNTMGNAQMFMSGRIYKYWYTDGTTTLDFIPVLSPQSSKCNGNPCMFDKVSKKLFCSKTGTDFTAGPKK